MVALGVDFGTSHTVAVARWPNGRARPLLFDGSPLLPSAVSLEETGLVVGRDAVHSARRAPESFEPNPKRRIDEGSVLLGERDVPVGQMMTAVFQRVLAEFTRTAGGAPDAVTVTHPAGWASTRRNTLQDAVRRSGLPAAALVPEPVAAATYFVRVLRHMVPVGSSVVVYDLGAGTFDGSVVARTAAGFEVLAVGGRDDLGGLDFDEVVVGLIRRALPAEDWQRVTSDPRSARQLRDEAREAKERLSRASSATVMVPLLDRDVPLTREEFEAAARPLVERSVRVLAETMRLSRLASDRVAGIFLVGGASQMPLIATELHREFGRPPVTIEQPEMVVAEGSVLVGRPVRTRGGRPVKQTPVVSGAMALPGAPATPVFPASVSPASVSPASVSPASVSPASVSPASGPNAPVSTPPISSPPISTPPVSPPISTPPVSPPSAGLVPISPPVQRRPPIVPQRPMYPPPMYPPAAYYPPPPPPQVVYFPTYAMAPMPRLRGPWSIRWPAGFMTTYGVLLYILTAVLLVTAGGAQLLKTEPKYVDHTAELDKVTSETLQWSVICVVLATLMVHGAGRARRPAGGHHWYPLALCVIVTVCNLALVGEFGGNWTLICAAVFAASTVMLLLPASRKWLRRPPKPSSRASGPPWDAAG